MNIATLSTPAGIDLRKVMGLYTEAQLAAALTITEDTLKSWRKDKVGPAYVKLGRGIFYRQSDIMAWVEQSVVATTSHEPASMPSSITHEATA